MSLGHGAGIIRSGLVLHLDAANRKSYPGSGTIWGDLSGNGNNGTLVNGVGYNSGNGGSMVFDGVNDYCSFPTWSQMSNSDEITMESWLRIDETPSNLALGYLGFNSPVNFFKFMNTGSLFLDIYNTNTSSRQIINIVTSISNHFGKWIFLSATYDGGSVKTYFNGSIQNTVTAAIASVASVNFSIGSGMGYYNFQGKNANCKLYNRALTAAEIKQNFEATRSRYGI